MFVFVLYAVTVWLGAARWRRRPGGFVCVFLGFVVLLGVALLHVQLSRWTEGKIYLPVLQSLLYPYIALVTGVGLFIAMLPTRAQCVEHENGCAWCGYDLRGLDAERTLRCPECGRSAIVPSAEYMEREQARKWGEDLEPAAGSRKTLFSRRVVPG